MNGTLCKVCRILRAEFLSPKDLLRHAVLIGVLFAVAHLAGLREFTTIVSGTLASPSLGVGVCALLGVGYMALYFGAVVLAPILLIAAGLLFAWEKVRGSSRPLLP
jgi:hypothetical protein